MFPRTATIVTVLSQYLPALAHVHEQLVAAPAGWTAISPAARNSTVRFTVALTQRNIDQLESRLLAVSTPGSATYGLYLDVDELNSFFAPTEGASSAVESWLRR